MDLTLSVLIHTVPSVASVSKVFNLLHIVKKCNNLITNFVITKLTTDWHLVM